jgi:hypothetical protein
MMLSETYLIIQETNMITSRDKYDVKWDIFDYSRDKYDYKWEKFNLLVSWKYI